MSKTDAAPIIKLGITVKSLNVLLCLFTLIPPLYLCKFYYITFFAVMPFL